MECDVAMFKKLDHECEPLAYCDLCGKSEIDSPTGRFGKLRDMYVDNDQYGLIACEECVPHELMDC